MSVPPAGGIHRVTNRMDLEQDGMGWDGVQLTRFMKGYKLCNNKGNVIFGEVMRMHEEDRKDTYYV